MISITKIYKSSLAFRIISQLLLVLVVFLLISYWQARELVRGEAPNLNAQLLTGESFELYKQAEKPILVHFWATWCPICEFENDNVEALADDYTIVTIASWSNGPDEVGNYMQEHGLTFPVIVDEDGEWARLYNVKGVPASFFIDSQRQIRMIEKGYTTEAGMRFRLWWLQE